MDRRTGSRLALVVGLALGTACGGGNLERPDPPPTTTVSEPEPAPSPTPRIYVVRRGDTLSEIAERFGTTVRALVRANDIEDRDALQVGQELVIPER